MRGDPDGVWQAAWHNGLSHTGGIRMSNVLAHITVTNSELFRDWPQEAIDHLVAHAEVIKVEAGTCVHESGATAEYLYLLASGSLDLRRVMPSGRKFTVRTHMVGDFQGLAPVLNQSAYWSAAIAKENSVLVRIPGRILRELLTKNGRLSFSIFAVLEARQMSSMSLYANASVLSLRARIAGHLLSLYERAGSRGAASVEIRLSQDDLAAMLGTGRQVVNRVLQEMAVAAAIEVNYGRILVKDKDKLAHMADDLD